MATSAYASTQETTNANRASRVLLGPCTDQFRDVLRQRISPSIFDYHVKLNRRRLPRLTAPQRVLILPSSGSYSGDYSDMDISLLYLLLRNLACITPHNNGWGNKPDITDTSLSASIDRIHESRNNVVHSSSAFLSDTDFNDLWACIKQGVQEMDTYLNNGKKYENEMDFLRTETMDPEQEQYIQQLIIQVEEDKTTKERVTKLEMLCSDQNEEILGIKVEQQESQINQTKLTENIQSNSKDMSSLRTQQQELQRQHTRLAENMQTHSGKIASLQTQQLESNRQQTTLAENVQTHSGEISSLQTQHQESQRQQSTLIEHIQTHSADISSLQTQQQEMQRQQITLADDLRRQNQSITNPDDGHDITRLKERIMEVNLLETQEIPLTVVQEDSDNLPIEQIFSSVVIKEDSKESRKSRKSAHVEKLQERKEVKTPEDMFTKNGKPVRSVLMLGDAAHGKTTYCMWLLKQWCNTQQPALINRPMNEWENALSQFHFVFHLPLRHVDPSRANVTDMICQDILGIDNVLQNAAKHVLSSDSFRCLIIMDGLDEWKPSQSAIDKLKFKGMPNIDSMSNCVIFTTMRVWKYAEVAKTVRDDVRVVEILGLDDKGIQNVIERILVNYYEMEPDSDEYVRKHKDITTKLKDGTLKSFIQIPLLAVVCVQIWYEGEEEVDSMTSFYIAMVDMLIERARLKRDLLEGLNQLTYQNLPPLLSQKNNITKYVNVLLKFGKVAYEGLLSKEIKLIFQKDKLEEEIGKQELQFALDVGLICQKEAPSVIKRKVSLHFFHKSVQEFLAALYIITTKENQESFLKYVSSVSIIMEFSNVIMFICGMCPYLGSVISQHAVHLTSYDTKICECRKMIPSFGAREELRDMYKSQVRWYMEFIKGNRDTILQFCIPDVYLYSTIGEEAISVANELLFDYDYDIKSLYMDGIPTVGDSCISNEELHKFLSNLHKTRSIVGIHILSFEQNNRCIHTICGPSLKNLCLYGVSVKDLTNDNEKVPFLNNTPLVEHIEIKSTNLANRDFGLTPNMTAFKWIRLANVNMMPSAWRGLLQSFIDIQHTFEVFLWDTDIDADSIEMIRSSPHFCVTFNDLNEYCMYKLEFTRVGPSAQELDTEH